MTRSVSILTTDVPTDRTACVTNEGGCRAGFVRAAGGAAASKSCKSEARGDEESCRVFWAVGDGAALEGGAGCLGEKGLKKVARAAREAARAGRACDGRGREGGAGCAGSGRPASSADTAAERAAGSSARIVGGRRARGLEEGGARPRKGTAVGETKAGMVAGWRDRRGEWERSVG